MRDVLTRFYSKLKEMPNGCIEWQGDKGEYGHGKFHLRCTPMGDSIRIGAHVFAYILHYKEEPFVVHHICENPSCCNPLHLKDVGNHEHMMIHKRKEVCPKGHEYAKVGRRKDGSCRECLRINDRNYRKTEGYKNRWRAY